MRTAAGIADTNGKLSNANQSNVCEKLYTEDEAAKLLRLSTRNMRNYRKAGLIAYIRISARMIRYTEGQLWEFLSRHRFQGDKPAPLDLDENGLQKWSDKSRRPAEEG